MFMRFHGVFRLCTKSPVRNLTQRSTGTFWPHFKGFSRPKSSILHTKSIVKEHFWCKAPTGKGEETVGKSTLRSAPGSRLPHARRDPYHHTAHSPHRLRRRLAHRSLPGAPGQCSLLVISFAPYAA